MDAFQRVYSNERPIPTQDLLNLSLKCGYLLFLHHVLVNKKILAPLHEIVNEHYNSLKVEQLADVGVIIRYKDQFKDTKEKHKHFVSVLDTF